MPLNKSWHDYNESLIERGRILLDIGQSLIIPELHTTVMEGMVAILKGVVLIRAQLMAEMVAQVIAEIVMETMGMVETAASKPFVRQFLLSPKPAVLLMEETVGMVIPKTLTVTTAMEEMVGKYLSRIVLMEVRAETTTLPNQWASMW